MVLDPVLDRFIMRSTNIVEGQFVGVGFRSQAEDVVAEGGPIRDICINTALVQLVWAIPVIVGCVHVLFFRYVVFPTKRSHDPL